MKKIAIFD